MQKAQKKLAPGKTERYVRRKIGYPPLLTKNMATKDDFPDTSLTRPVASRAKTLGLFDKAFGVKLGLGTKLK